MMRQVTLNTGETVPALGLGTWQMGTGEPDEAGQIRAIQTGVDLGMKLIDTAEMYGEGRSESLVGKAIAGRRKEVFLVTKVIPSNASRLGAISACEASLKRLGTDMIDLYLLHWRGRFPLAETVEAFEELKTSGKIRHYGVSNFDAGHIKQLGALSPKPVCAANQVQYNLADRGIEFDLLPDCQRQEIVIMAYCPLGQGGLVNHPALAPLARKHGVTSAAIALAFLILRPGVIAIPKSAAASRVTENAKAAGVTLDEADLAAIDAAFPPPKRKMPLAMT